MKNKGVSFRVVYIANLQTYLEVSKRLKDVHYNCIKLLADLILRI